jgi:dolichol-phosphate mannosyltransferase
MRLSILIPVRNEGVNLGIMLRLLGAVMTVSYEVLVVYDSLDDDTLPVLEQLVAAGNDRLRGVHNTLGPGVVNAIRAGVAVAQGELVLIFAADEVGPVLSIDEMLSLIDEGCDFVSCTRYAHGGRRLGGSLVGHLLSRAANRLFQRVAGCVMTDATTGIKLFRRELFDRLELSANPIGWSVAFEMAIRAQVLGLTIGEVPIISIDRLFGGESTFKVGPWVFEYSRLFLWGLRELRNAPVSVSQGDVRVKLPSRAGSVSQPLANPIPDRPAP